MPQRRTPRTRATALRGGRRALAIGACLLGLVGAPAAARAATDEAPEYASLVRSVSEVESLIRDAHFRTAVGVAESTREWADRIPSRPEVRELRSRLQVLLATAWIALGQDDDARRAMRRAVAVWPLLELDTDSSSPRVVALWRAVRSDQHAAGGSR